MSEPAISLDILLLVSNVGGACYCCRLPFTYRVQLRFELLQQLHGEAFPRTTLLGQLFGLLRVLLLYPEHLAHHFLA
uniref:Putative secreted protein n=1 Tax=Anopheles marajoara TaxID=58244 RepID=A0A2M4CCH8_9DIPT